ncbi:MAG: hypothetical protein DI598_08980 [Pseudopedobacter saltans]|uniref:Uncharacterized protein n=1 Tax=Pseudopedobacter saltans TaxID=151895 RepID=A0A2W5F0J5_9SPHI|nr:MAG: hypothetical protein DI598_08980 [Pseudopedobacter saltans]
MTIAALTMISMAKAQVSIGVSIGTPAPVYAAPAPVWVPAASPASPYYYFPDINCYYDMGIGQYIYLNNNRWIYSRAVPARFARYDFRRARIMPMTRSAFGYRGIPAYRGGGRQVIVNNNYAYGGGKHFNNDNHFGNGKGNNGHWNNGGGNRGNGHGGGRGRR